MPDFQGSILGAAGGFMAGGPIGAGIGFLGGLLSDSPEEKRQKAVSDAIAELDKIRLRTLERGRKTINQSIQSNLAFASAGAARRARQAGANDAEAFVIPAQTGVISEGNKALTSFESNTNNQYDSAIANLKTGQALSPVSPSFGDYILPIGEAIGKYKQNQDYISMLKGAGQTVPTESDIKPKPINFDYQPNNGGSTPLGRFSNSNLFG